MKKFLTDEEMAELEAKSVPQTLSNKKFLTDEEMAKLEAMQKPSVTSSALRGAAQGVTFGFSDEIAGAAEAAYDVATTDKKLSDLKDLYRQRRDESRELNELAAKANPKAYTAGEITGGLASLVVPVGVVGRGVGALSKLGTVGKAVTTGAALGAAGGAGYSEEETVRGTLADMAIGATTGAALGAAGGAAGKAAGKFIEKAPEAAKSVSTSSIKEVLREGGKETAKGLAGAAIGGAIGGPAGAVAGGLILGRGVPPVQVATKTAKDVATLVAAKPGVQKAFTALKKALTGKNPEKIQEAVTKLRLEGVPEDVLQKLLP
jgi:hypothetical protein